MGSKRGELDKVKGKIKEPKWCRPWFSKLEIILVGMEACKWGKRKWNWDNKWLRETEP